MSKLINPPHKLKTVAVPLFHRRALYLIVIGPAGSGKSTLVKSLGEWVERNQGISVSYVNLDPGAEYVPYRPDVDVRHFVRVEDLMRERGLGPNGALVASMEELLLKREEVLKGLDNLNSDFVLVDTPGQMELFLFHEVGPSFSQEFAKRGAACALLLFDAALASRPSHVVMLKTMGLAAQLRLGLPTIIALNKSDLSSASRASTWLKEPERLQIDLLDEPGVFSDLASHLASLLDRFSFARRIPAVSAIKGEGLEAIYDLVHEIWCACGDLT